VCGHDANAVSPAPAPLIANTSKAKRDAVTGLPLGSWGRRLGATLADGFVLVIPLLFAESFFTAVAGQLDGVLAGLVLQGLYMVRLVSGKNGQTVGNRVAATRVVDATTGGVVSVMQAFKRWGLIALLAVPLVTGTTIGTEVYVLLTLVDCLWPLWDRRNQTLHDKVANTLVVLK